MESTEGMCRVKLSDFGLARKIGMLGLTKFCFIVYYFIICVYICVYIHIPSYCIIVQYNILYRSICIRLLFFEFACLWVQGLGSVRVLAFRVCSKV